MKPGRYDMSIYRGDDAAWRFILWSDTAQTVAVDLSGVTAKSEIRPRSGSSTIVALDVSITLPNTIDVTLTGTKSATLYGGSVWDLQLTYPSGAVRTVLYGKARVTADVTDSSLPARSPIPMLVEATT